MNNCLALYVVVLNQVFSHPFLQYVESGLLNRTHPAIHVKLNYYREFLDKFAFLALRICEKRLIYLYYLFYDSACTHSDAFVD